MHWSAHQPWLTAALTATDAYPSAGLVIFQSRTIAGMAKHIRPMVHRKGGKSREIGDGGSDDGNAAGSDAGYSHAHGGVVKGKVRGCAVWFTMCV